MIDYVGWLLFTLGILTEIAVFLYAIVPIIVLVKGVGAKKE